MSSASGSPRAQPASLAGSAAGSRAGRGGPGSASPPGLRSPESVQNLSFRSSRTNASNGGAYQIPVHPPSATSTPHSKPSLGGPVPPPLTVTVSSMSNQPPPDTMGSTVHSGGHHLTLTPGMHVTTSGVSGGGRASLGETQRTVPTEGEEEEEQGATQRRQSLHVDPAAQLGSVHDALQEELAQQHSPSPSPSPSPPAHPVLSQLEEELVRQHSPSPSPSPPAHPVVSQLEEELYVERAKVADLSSRNEALERLLHSSDSADKAKVGQLQQELSKRARKIKDLENSLRKVRGNLRRKTADVDGLRKELQARIPVRDETPSQVPGRGAVKTSSPSHPLHTRRVYHHERLQDQRQEEEEEEQLRQYEARREKAKALPHHPHPHPQHQQNPNQPPSFRHASPLNTTPVSSPSPNPYHPSDAPFQDLPDVLAQQLSDTFALSTSSDVNLLAKHLLARAQVESPEKLRSNRDPRETALNIIYDYTCSPTGSPKRW